MKALTVAAAAASASAAAVISQRDLGVGQSISGGWELVGCYTDVGRTISAASYTNSSMTNEQCTTYCQDLDMPYAGTEYYTECYCGSRLATGSELAADSSCSTPCSGNSTQACGGPNRLTMWNNPTMSTPQQPLNVTVAASGITWYSLGCKTEATGMRALSAAAFSTTTSMTLEACAAYCANYKLFGTEYGAECYCGNALNPGSVDANADDCSMQCSGNKLEYCGAGDRLSVYSVDKPVESSSSLGPTPATSLSSELSTIITSIVTGVSSSPTFITVTTTPSGTTSVSASTASPTADGLPSGWESYGCFVDGAQGRILSYQAPDNDSLTLALCATICEDAGYTVAGAEYSYQCFCGNAILNNASRADATDCNAACRGNPDEMCGGPDRMTILSAGGPPTIEAVPVPQTAGLGGSWSYVGCVEDGVNGQRTFPWQIIMPSMTADECTSKCSAFGFMAAGMEYGRECYCGDPADVTTANATLRPDSECSMPCAGNATGICGAGSRMTTYFWNTTAAGGDPLYAFDYPEADDPAAGAYEFLIGGVCIPLITSQAITGKVTFLEKSGTGPPNSTGAYELDLSEIDNFQAAWRTMHVKTDVFCAATVTLPDKAGRQLNIGGWSGTSTYGVRLYTPDGSPGVMGTNDWEENVNELSLQKGRWYPSAMVMTNGSVLVVGGEDGSNGAPVPSIEILPNPHNWAPIEKEWLRDTDPNNLYPFLFVLPSGNIFVGYWNRARLLDPVTLNTTRVLPNMPGSVADSTGGRTYPLEGTAVLLPQHAPYTDPVTVLICGGSTMGAGYAIDNCVSTQPDVEGAEWVLERMPSRRVMSCMAPLPDGTYLINNGAHQGVAGFGLATDPNLNALLYDPRKPVHQRITVAANTTVARLYHSESITLLDGRVLVSGSDPEDGVHPQEYRVEVFIPPYLRSGKPRPTFTLEESQRDWAYGSSYSFTLGSAPQNGDIEVSLLGSVGSTHGNSMGARTLFPAVSCSGTTCSVTAPPRVEICPPGWYQFFVLDGGIPAIGVYVRIGGDPAGLGNWPNYTDFTTPGV
ncbi:hypothetical protein TD95_001872 [Thielaviopsis punctulata]|uniref:WSC domain-containing protein n=1 Tax=Thielaviopsis punctulata TaxID=72032 RepID=A0A0F4ZFH8_9PEZI|nr:hypothetical protein TD95_001872 [Thielaviopsis punctulata]